MVNYPKSCTILYYAKYTKLLFFSINLFFYKLSTDGIASDLVKVETDAAIFFLVDIKLFHVVEELAEKKKQAMIPLQGMADVSCIC